MSPDADAPSSAPGPTAARPARRRFWWLRWVLLAVVVAILGVEVGLVWPKLEEGFSHAHELRWHWVVACFVAAMFSMLCYAYVQQSLLRSAGVRVRGSQSLAVILAANSVSQTMPAGQVLSPAFIYRETRKWGATPIVASWQLVMSGLLAGVGLAVLGFGGALIAGAQTSPFSVIFSVGAFIAFVVVMQYVASRPETLEGLGGRILAWVNRLRAKPADTGIHRLRGILDQLRAVKLDRREAAVSFSWSLLNRIADVACLGFACWAVGSYPSISGLMVAYAASKAAGMAIPLLPGGLGVVEVVLVPTLVSAGMPAAQAVTAVLVYRLVSLVFVSVVGWVVVAVQYRGAIRGSETLESELASDLEAEQRADGGSSDQAAGGRAERAAGVGDPAEDAPRPAAGSDPQPQPRPPGSDKRN